ncbi:MAG: enoyl-CoA hydratase-related protein [Steroidobacteraceae bacterium]|jgi:methylglutaconyl-CoA hydratase|nr:enoyl-CoA hydratase/isomerase family protein [Steroidobacteraceae bacterium]
MSASVQGLSIDTDGRGVARLTLDRPERHNAFDGALIGAIHTAVDRLARNPVVRAIVVTGAGNSFCAGADLGHMRAMSGATEEANHADALALAQMLAALDACSKPVVARVNGDTFGGGVGLVACCDIAVGLAGARFALSEVRLGLVPATISPFVIAAIGARATRALALTGERFDGTRAQALGLLHEVADDLPQLDATLERILADLLQGGPEAQREVKSLVREVAGAPCDAALQRSTSHRLARLRLSQEARERLSAFLARRKRL